ncbi:MAG: WD40/YVTN/BNR-like repeat-containing protein [Candidatus Oleimicrobiaceae bacterium]
MTGPRVRVMWTITLAGMLLYGCTKVPVGPESATWSPRNLGLGSPYVQCLAVDPHDENVIYAGTFGGLFRSVDAGRRWQACGEGITSSDISAIAVSPHRGDLLLCGTWGKGVFLSKDGGRTWLSRSNGIRNPRVNAVAFDIEDSSRIYAATTDAMFVSDDGGCSWQPCFPYGNVRSVAQHPLQAQVLYVGVEYHGLLKTEDGGLAWQPKNSGLHRTEGSYDAPWDIAFDPAEPRIMYVATGIIDLHKSEDGGETWKLLSDGLDWRRVRQVAVDKSDPRSIYAATDRGVMRSADGGSKWYSMSEGLSSTNVRAIVVTRTAVYAGTYGGGVFRYAPKP